MYSAYLLMKYVKQKSKKIGTMIFKRVVGFEKKFVSKAAPATPSGPSSASETLLRVHKKGQQ